MRVEIVKECVHGKTEPHSWGGAPIDPGWHHFPHKPNVCDEGSRRVLTEGEFLLIEKENGKWPDDPVADRAFMESMVETRQVDGWLTPRAVRKGRLAMLDALAGSE